MSEAVIADPSGGPPVLVPAAESTAKIIETKQSTHSVGGHPALPAVEQQPPAMESSPRSQEEHPAVAGQGKGGATEGAATPAAPVAPEPAHPALLDRSASAPDRLPGASPGGTAEEKVQDNSPPPAGQRAPERGRILAAGVHVRSPPY